MAHLSKFIFCALAVFFLAAWSSPSETTLSKGRQPQISVDDHGVVRVVFGRSDSIFCTTSVNKGATFSLPVLVGVVPKMHLGMARGPQLASSTNYSVITAMDQAGNIHFFMLNHRKGTLQNKGLVNDLKGSAPEGLMNIACDDKDNFYATWLDIRLNKRNNIYFSSLPAGHTQWLKNTLVYQSPDEHVCECCRPSIAVKGSRVAIMFRNWLNGSRDLYLTTSVNDGQTFGTATKIGDGTWKMNACTMDGGGLHFNTDNTVSTTWQRKGTVYYCKPGQNERELGKGRDCSISPDRNRVIVSFSDQGSVKFTDVAANKETIVGKGSYLKTLVLPDNKILCVWEEDNSVKTKIL